MPVACPRVLLTFTSLRRHSHWSAVKSLSDWLKEQGVCGLAGVDTRALTKHLRSCGSTLGKVVVEGDAEDEVQFYDPNVVNLVAKVSTDTVKEYNKTGSPHIVAVDVGLKNNQLRCLIKRGARVTLVPWDFDFSTAPCDGVFLSNGPGDPTMADKTIVTLKKVAPLARLAEKRGRRGALVAAGAHREACPPPRCVQLLATEGHVPIFGICLGHQLLSLALGTPTYKMAFGNRGHNQPCTHEQTRRCFITSQNHGFAVDHTKLPEGWLPLFTNENDGTNEGIVHSSKPIFSVQFHPEASAGPQVGRDGPFRAVQGVVCELTRCHVCCAVLGVCAAAAA